jgi:hypothetical protein
MWTESCVGGSMFQKITVHLQLYLATKYAAYISEPGSVLGVRDT